MMSNGNSNRASQQLLAELTSLTDKLQEIETPENPQSRNKIRKELRTQADRVHLAADRLDPILKPLTLFDPSDPLTSGRIIALTTVAQPRHPLSLVKPFYGAGVYALYYNGSFEPYSGLSRTEQPIYVGKANPKDPNATDPTKQGAVIHDRLKEHRRSISRAASTLEVDDFECRFLVVQSGFQLAAEEYLIRFFQPIWNNEVNICYGIGKHGDSSKTRGNKRSPWDTIHPGRHWADEIEDDQKTAVEIVEQIRVHLQKRRPHKSVDEVLGAIMADLSQLGPNEFRTAAGEQAAVEATEVKTIATAIEPGEERLF